MHTHFASATHLASTFLSVLLAGTLWRLVTGHILATPTAPSWAKALARGMAFQY